MSIRVFYHNITQKEFNIGCLIDFLESYNDGDLIMKSQAGCALLEPITDQELKDLWSEYEQYQED